MNHLDEYTLNEYIDRNLDEAALAEAETHLQTCVDCQTELSELQNLFAELEELSEARLEHDLTSAILERLPDEGPVYPIAWTRALAAQLGAVFGFVFWLGIQLTSLVGIPQITFPKLPTVEIQSLFLRLLSVQFPIPNFKIPVFSYGIPTIDFQLPTFIMQLSTNHIATLAISSLLLWVVGNFVLLRSRQEPR